jgi:hypothetical protein
MQISRRILIACVTTTFLFPIFLQAAETEAQIKARQALEQKMNELATQPAVPEPAKPAVSPAKPAKPVEPKPSKVVAPVNEPAPVAPVVKKPEARPPQPKSASPVFEPVPQPAASPDAGKAREALQQKMSDLSQQPAAATTQTTSEKPSFQTIPGDARPARPEQAASEPKQKKVKAEKSATEFQALQGPPTGLSAAKEQRLYELLQDYKADKLSPDEYHTERAKILAAP